MDRLTLMRSFLSVTRSRTFSQAARSLGISGSLVSRHVSELERDLGVRLVNRTARTVSLTEAGARYGEFAARIIDEIDREEESLRGLRQLIADFNQVKSLEAPSHSVLVSPDGAVDPALSVANTGYIGIPTAAPNTRLEVVGSGAETTDFIAGRTIGIRNDRTQRFIRHFQNL